MFKCILIPSQYVYFNDFDLLRVLFLLTVRYARYNYDAYQWFPPGPLISSINKTDHHDITEILYKVAICSHTFYLTLIGQVINRQCHWESYYFLVQVSCRLISLSWEIMILRGKFDMGNWVPMRKFWHGKLGSHDESFAL